MRLVQSEYISPASPVVLEKWGHSIRIAASESASSILMKAPSVRVVEDKDELPPTSRKFDKLFAHFPSSLVVCGDAERLEREVKNLVDAMSNDGVDVTTKWVRDAVHDILIFPEGWWDESAREDVYDSIKKWMKEV
jgi:acetyl esterase/lipase